MKKGIKVVSIILSLFLMIAIMTNFSTSTFIGLGMYRIERLTLYETFSGFPVESHVYQYAQDFNKIYVYGESGDTVISTFYFFSILRHYPSKAYFEKYSKLGELIPNNVINVYLPQHKKDHYFFFFQINNSFEDFTEFDQKILNKLKQIYSQNPNPNRRVLEVKL